MRTVPEDVETQSQLQAQHQARIRRYSDPFFWSRLWVPFFMFQLTGPCLSWQPKPLRKDKRSRRLTWNHFTRHFRGGLCCGKGSALTATAADVRTPKNWTASGIFNIAMISDNHFKMRTFCKDWLEVAQPSSVFILQEYCLTSMGSPHPLKPFCTVHIV